MLLAALHDFIAAERDLEEISYNQDPAYSAWMRDAELAHERLTETLRSFHGLDAEVREDQPLKRMAKVIDEMLGHEEPGGARRLHLAMQVAFFTRFQASGIGATAMHRNGLLVQARHLVTAMIQLPLFDSASLEEAASEHDAETEMWAAF
ncbi:hypothetical protein [Marivita sp. GX14005]|uniref:hypothetical protein n=1 Tax=Marivita sp. GX14005 TaxID=2942276 RepID=UPI00201959BD|nr:hypothetical protein [Marivita sp. GX14005]MCL3881913.1 hypothetical protein [Marivita sp. GX14005]